MKAAVVDASVWVSFFLPQDEHHVASERWLEHHLRPGGLAIAPTLLLAEVAGPIARQTNKPELGSRALAALLRLRGLRLIANDRRLAVEAAELAASLKIRGADASYITIAMSTSLPLVTWDCQQRELGLQAVAVVSPEDMK